MTSEPMQPSEQQPMPTNVSDLEREIARTRAELADTVEALAERADLKLQAHKAAEQVKHQAQVRITEAKDRLRSSTDLAKDRVRAGAVQVGQQAPATISQIGTRAQATAGPAIDRASHAAAGLGARVTADPRIPAAIAGVLIAAAGAVWWRGREL